MGTENGQEDRNGAEYLAQLLKDKKQIQAFPNVFIHLERLLDDEINKVRITLFNLEKKPLLLPEEEGPKVQLTEKLFVPVKDHPDFNFVGRILGPRGITAKQLERDTGCKIMVRGKGSMRDKKKEEQMRGKPNWEHLSEELHVLIVVEDTQHRAEAKMSRAMEEVKKLLVPAPEGEDELKKRQLMELAIINGTYRDTKSSTNSIISVSTSATPPSSISPLTGATGSPAALAAAVASQMQQRLIGQPVLSANPGMLQAANMMGLQNQLYRPQQNAQQVLLSPRLATSAPSTQQSVLGAMPPPLVSPADPNAALMYSSALPTSQDLTQYSLAAQNTLLDYHHAAVDQSAAGAVPKVRRTAVAAASAAHPYQRI